MSGKEQWAEFEKEEEEADMIEDSDQESADWSQTKLLYYYYTVTTLIITTLIEGQPRPPLNRHYYLHCCYYTEQSTIAILPPDILYPLSSIIAFPTGQTGLNNDSCCRQPF